MDYSKTGPRCWGSKHEFHFGHVGFEVAVECLGEDVYKLKSEQRCGQVRAILDSSDYGWSVKLWACVRSPSWVYRERALPKRLRRNNQVGREKL